MANAKRQELGVIGHGTMTFSCEALTSDNAKDVLFDFCPINREEIPIIRNCQMMIKSINGILKMLGV